MNRGAAPARTTGNQQPPPQIGQQRNNVGPNPTPPVQQPVRGNPAVPQIGQQRNNVGPNPTPLVQQPVRGNPSVPPTGQQRNNVAPGPLPPVQQPTPGNQTVPPTGQQRNNVAPGPLPPVQQPTPGNQTVPPTGQQRNNVAPGPLPPVQQPTPGNQTVPPVGQQRNNAPPLGNQGTNPVPSPTPPAQQIPPGNRTAPQNGQPRNNGAMPAPAPTPVTQPVQPTPLGNRAGLPIGQQQRNAPAANGNQAVVTHPQSDIPADYLVAPWQEVFKQPMVLATSDAPTLPTRPDLSVDPPQQNGKMNQAYIDAYTKDIYEAQIYLGDLAGRPGCNIFEYGATARLFVSFYQIDAAGREVPARFAYAISQTHEAFWYKEKKDSYWYDLTPPASMSNKVFRFSELSKSGILGGERYATFRAWARFAAPATQQQPYYFKLFHYGDSWGEQDERLNTKLQARLAGRAAAEAQTAASLADHAARIEKEERMNPDGYNVITPAVR